MTRTFPLIIALTSLVSSSDANEISGLEVSPPVVRAGTPVAVVVQGEGSFCGLKIDFGDKVRQRFKIDSKAGTFPKVVSHIYDEPGKYQLWVKGAQVTTHFACRGSALATVTVVPLQAPEPICPDGWQLLPGSPAKDGSFTCKVREERLGEPREPIVCGPGYGYFETSGEAGCRREW